ncbi:MAG: CotH kinase family protein [Lachnospiraceae bacterium]|nr:CotH kinase family protein [Lachnospiraceae bacterium]
MMICILLLLLAAFLYGTYRLDEWLTDNQILAVSMESGFYTEDISVSVRPKKRGTVYYTEDGSEPDKEDRDSTKCYEEPLELRAGGREQVKVYRFRVYYPDGTSSKVVTNTYYMGKEITSRYDTLVMNVSTDPDNLYRYEDGIFIEGKIRDDYLADHPDEEVDFDTPANFNQRGRESERPAHLEVFEPDGTRVVTQDVGIRTSGGATRTSEQKSFKIYGRYEYSADNKLKYAFLLDEKQKDTNTVVDRFECLKIRNTGNDRLEAFIRDELGMRLAEQAGLQDIQYVRPVSVYFNGIYNGLYWIHSVYDDSYFKERYGNYDGEMVVLGQQEGNMSTDSTKEIENQYAEAYNEWYNEIHDLDLTVPENYAKVESTIDVDNYLQYMAAEIYMANQD